ncbi:MAG: hypothetical protein RIR18_544 [Pseudomonadota bacterium]|jgi:outer membrane protein OmpA-like peptidoglycan-associated protein
MLSKHKILTAAVCMAFASGCATDPKTGQFSIKETFASDDPCSNNSRNIGVFAGAVVGTIIGNQMKNSDASRLIGASIGAALGGLIGADVDRQRCELSKIAKKHQTKIDSSPIEIKTDADINNSQSSQTVGISVDVGEPDGGHFAKGSDQLTPKAKEYFTEVTATFNAQKASETITDPKAKAEYLKQSANRKLFLVGHTDDTGSTQLNVDLSERRAKAVAKFLTSQGIKESQIYYQGAGEMYPIANNNQEAGRAANRRVQLVQVQDEAAFHNYLTQRISKLSYFRPNTTDTTVAEAASIDIEKVSNKKSGTGKKNTDPTTITSVSKPTKSAKPEPLATEKTTPSKGLIDFGGVPYGDEGAKIDPGKVAEKSGFSLISKAHADQPLVIGSCKNDRPRSSGEIKSLSGDAATKYSTNEKLPGLFGRTWRDMVGAHLVVINNLSVLREGTVATNLPEIKVYANYDPKDTQAKPAITETPQVNVYQGDKGYLVRTFLNGKGGIKCIDMLSPPSPPFAAKEGRIIYTHNSTDYMAKFTPRMAD